jgi:hypothetical protein
MLLLLTALYCKDYTYTSVLIVFFWPLILVATALVLFTLVVGFFCRSFLFLNEEDEEGGVPEISIGTGNSVKNTEYNPHNLKLAFKQCKEFVDCNELIE